MLLRYFLPPSSVGREVVTMLTVFVVLALILGLMLHVASEQGRLTSSSSAI